MNPEPTTQHCDHPDYQEKCNILFGQRSKDYICTKCGRTFLSPEAMREGVAENQSLTTIHRWCPNRVPTITPEPDTGTPNMPTTTHQSVSATDVLQAVTQFLKTEDQLEISLDDIRIEDSALSHLIRSSDYFEQHYVDQLLDLRDQAGACIAQACHAANIPGLDHWTDNDPETLETHFQEFQRRYFNFLQDVREAAQELEAEGADILTTADVNALHSLTAPLSRPLYFAKCYTTGQNPLQDANHPARS